MVAQGDLVRLGDGASLDGSQPLAETLASLPQELERVGEGALRSGALRISLVLFDEVCLQGRSDLVGRLERLIGGRSRAMSSTMWRVSCTAGSASWRVPALALARTAQHLVHPRRAS